MMFSVFCPTHDSRILMTRRNAVSFWNGPDGPVIGWKCSCGHEGFLDHTGSHAHPRSIETEIDTSDHQERRQVA